MIKHERYNRGNIYLSGGMEHAENEGADWRETISIWLKELSYYPLDICALDKAYARKYGHFLRNINSENLLEKKSNVRKHFIQTDLQLVINDSDALIVYYDESVRKGAGTISECMIAYQHDIPIFLVSDWEDWENEVPGWLQALTTKIFTDFNELYKYLERLPPGVIKRDIYGNHHSGDYYLCSLSGEVFEKSDLHFVSKISPLYSKQSVDAVRKTHEEHVDRYQFILQHLQNEARMEMLEEEISTNELNKIRSNRIYQRDSNGT